MSREHHEGCVEQGVYAKYDVHRTDGADQQGGRHDGCWYFVLDPRHDPEAAYVLCLYAELIDGERSQLAEDLRWRPEIRNNPYQPAYAKVRAALERIHSPLRRGAS